MSSPAQQMQVWYEALTNEAVKQNFWESLDWLLVMSHRDKHDTRLEVEVIEHLLKQAGCVVEPSWDKVCDNETVLDVCA